MEGVIMAQESTGQWEAPVSAVSKKNPIPADAHSLALGKEVFEENCLPCHGASGRGDGPASKALTKKPGNLTDAKRMETQTDGALYWKIGEGSNPMPEFKDALTDDQRWEVINYVKTLARKDNNH